MTADADKSFREKYPLLSLCKEASTTLKMWADVAPAVSLIADLDAAIAAAEAQLTQEPIATTCLPDHYDERDGAYFSLADVQKLQALPAGTKLYTHPAAPTGAEPTVGITLTEAFDAGWGFRSDILSGSLHDARDVMRVLNTDGWPALLRNLPDVSSMRSRDSAIVHTKQAIYALLENAVAQPGRDGWQLVPIEPTPEMLEQIKYMDEITDIAMTVRYKAMLKAVPVVK